MGEYYDSGESVEVGTDSIMIILIGAASFVGLIVGVFLLGYFIKKK